MGTKQTPGEHWDGEQMERDTAGVPVGKPQDDVWNRHQMKIDDTGSDTDPSHMPLVDDEPPAGGLSGHGKPDGESHWDRVDDTSKG